MKDPRVEQWLTREGVDWHGEKSVPLSQVDWEASLKNQARLKLSLIPEHVDELSVAIIDGVQLPDPVGYYNKDGRIVIISGNHRVAAHKQINELKLGNIETLDWYIVNSYVWKLDILTRTSNVIEGWPLTMEERVEQTDKHFEDNIVALIEAKHHKSEVGDMDWRDAMRQGKEKATKHGLNSYIVTNCLTNYRFYSSHTDDEIFLDGKPLSKPQPLLILELIQTQVNPENRYVIYKANKTTTPFSEAKFRTTLRKLADIYRSCGLKKGDGRIDPTVSFVVLKYIGEKELEYRTLPKKVNIWKDYGQDKGIWGVLH